MSLVQWNDEWSLNTINCTQITSQGIQHTDDSIYLPGAVVTHWFAVTIDVHLDFNIIKTPPVDRIVVYPVQDENKYTDQKGNVLPDGFFLSESINLSISLVGLLKFPMLCEYACIGRPSLIRSFTN